jgi:hypothetical protein
MGLCKCNLTNTVLYIEAYSVSVYFYVIFEELLKFTNVREISYYILGCENFEPLFICKGCSKLGSKRYLNV